MDQTGVLLMAYGAAGSLEEIEPYLKDILGGRPVKPELVEEVKRRYTLMGGRSPLLEITRSQAEALEKALNAESGRFRVYIGMRHWHPYIKDTVEKMADDGIRRVIALCLTPYYSKLSVGAYFSKLSEAVAHAGRISEVRRIESWNDHPLLILALVEKVRGCVARFPTEIRDRVPILFTAHSLPERILAEKDPYPEELHETIRLVMKEVGPNPWRMAYQSKGRTSEPWLGPDASAVIDTLHAEGARDLIIAPIGFVSDHMETLYDVDVMYRNQCQFKGIRMVRVDSLNDSPAFIEALTAVVREQVS